MYFQLAWRNIWRNPRRTTVILLAVIIGVWSMIFENALMRGIAEGMIENGIATLTGHIQIHYEGYRNDPVIENSILDPEVVLSALENTLPTGARWASRVRVNGIASNARHSSGITIVGIDPTTEGKVSFIGDAISRGRQLKPEDPHAILVGEALMDKFETKIGHKLVLMSQDTHQEIASRAFRIVGTFRAEMQSTEKQFVFITRKGAQQMLRLKKGISEISIIIPDQSENVVSSRLKAILTPGIYEVHTWQESLPFLRAYLKLLDAWIYIWSVVVFIAMGFGIVNTTLMAVFERIREFGLMKALGMKPWWIIREVLTESFLLLIMGMIIGNMLAFLTVFALSDSGIDLSALAAGVEFAGMTRVIYPVVSVKDWSIANLVVLGLGILICIYPAAKAARFTPVKALAHT
jgi:ABC-type lipoprotein release transport system permease subunit